MSDPTLDDLRVPYLDGRYPMTRPLTPTEFDRIARERGFVKVSEATSPDLYRQWANDNGYVKRPDCECTVAYMVDDTTPTGEQPPDPDCPCGGTGFGRLVALDGIILDAIRRHYEREAQMWPEGVERAPKSETMVRVVDIHEALVAIDRGDTDGVA